MFDILAVIGTAAFILLVIGIVGAWVDYFAYIARKAGK